MRVGVRVREGVNVSVGVRVGVGVRVRVGVNVLVGVRVMVGVGVREGVKVIVGVRVMVGVSVGGVGPWKTKRTASSPTNSSETAAVSSCVRLVSSTYSSPAPLKLYLPTYSHPSVT